MYDIIMRGDRLVVPCGLTSSVLSSYEAHDEMSRIKQRLRELYWYTQVEDVIKMCATKMIKQLKQHLLLTTSLISRETLR